MENTIAKNTKKKKKKKQRSQKVNLKEAQIFLVLKKTPHNEKSQ